MAKKFMARHNHWLKYAQDDLYLAKISLSPEHVIVFAALFHAQQCAEKSLKAYLAFKNKMPPRTHDLCFLIRLCAQFDYKFNSCFEDALDLKPFASTTRYPDDMCFFPELTVTRSLIEKAEKMLSFVIETIEYESLLMKKSKF